MSKKGISLLTALRKYDLNHDQKTAIECIRNNKIVILTGVAGTSKSFTAVYAALKLLTENNNIEQVSLTRPMVTTERIGFLPGSTSDKYAPYLAPLAEFFNKFGDSGENTFSSMVAARKIIERPIAFLRGATIENEIMICDESQGLTPAQMLMVLTRVSKDGKLVITGDAMQSDLSGTDPTGLDYVIALSKHLPYIQEIQMTQNMRDPMIQEIIDNWGKGIKR